MPGKSGGHKIGRNQDKCQKYLSAGTRIKNKTRKLVKRIKNIKPETQKIILSKNKIGRAKER